MLRYNRDDGIGTDSGAGTTASTFFHKRKPVVLCQNKDKGAETRKACTAGCIGCMKCAKACPKEAITVENFLDASSPFNAYVCMGMAGMLLAQITFNVGMCLFILRPWWIGAAASLFRWGQGCDQRLPGNA